MIQTNRYILFAAALLALAACTREAEMESENAVLFTASVESPFGHVSDTRTTYGSVDGSTMSLLWSAGDRITIWSPDAAVYVSGNETHPAVSYTVNGQDANSTYGKATGITVVSGSNRLEWGTPATHTFYGKYPDPSWTASEPYAASSAFKNQDPASASFVCWLPATTSVTPTGDNYTYAQGMTYCYMTAYASVPRNTAVDLDFEQAVTAFRINIPTDGILSNLAISRVELSSASHRLNGQYTVNIAASRTYTIPESSLTEADRTVAMAFSTPVSAAEGHVLRMTLFTCPVSAADLTLTAVCSDGTKLVLQLKTAEGEWFSFQPGKFYDINCGEVTDPDSETPEPRPFTIDAQGHQVVLARGNLMALIGSYNAPVATAIEWKFGEPTEIIGGAETDGNYLFAAGVPDCVGKWVDLFSWQGASSTNDASHRVHGLVSLTYSDSQPYHGNQGSETLYEGCWDGLDISNGDGYDWHMLSGPEWSYIFNERPSPRHAMASVAGRNGLILFPDNYEHPTGVAAIANADDTVPTTFEVNVYDANDWTRLEAAGCVFLPGVGWRSDGTTFNLAGDQGCYWTSTSVNSVSAYNLNYRVGTVTPVDRSHRFRGMAVRLVRDL